MFWRDCVILFIKATGKNINFTGKRQGKHREFKLEKGAETMLIYFTYETGSCRTTVQFLQKVHGVDITHDNVCSSMLSYFYSYVAATINRASYF